MNLDSAWVRDSRLYQLFFSLVGSPAFRDAPHSRFRRVDPSQCFLNLLKVLLLALLQIYTRLFYLWKSVALGNALFGDSKLCLQVKIKMLVLALPQIYTSVFHLWKFIDLDSAQSHQDMATKA